METVTALGRDADAFDEDPLKTMPVNRNHETDFPFHPANCYML